MSKVVSSKSDRSLLYIVGLEYTMWLKINLFFNDFVYLKVVVIRFNICERFFNSLTPVFSQLLASRILYYVLNYFNNHANSSFWELGGFITPYFRKKNFSIYEFTNVEETLEFTLSSEQVLACSSR